MPDMLGVWKRYQVNANGVFLNHLNQMEVWKCHCFRDVGKILGLNFWHYNLAYIVCFINPDLQALHKVKDNI